MLYALVGLNMSRFLLIQSPIIYVTFCPLMCWLSNQSMANHYCLSHLWAAATPKLLLRRGYFMRPRLDMSRRVTVSSLKRGHLITAL